MTRIEELSDGRLAFVVSLVPRAPRDEVVGWTVAGKLKVRVKAPPVDEAANRQLVRFLSETLEIAKRDLSIASGGHSRRKRLIAPGACKNRLLSFADI